MTYTIFVIGMVLLAVISLYRKPLKKKIMEAVDYLKLKTWDIVSDRRIATLHPLIRARVKEFIISAEKELGITLRVTSGLRTWEEQQKLYDQGRTAPGKVVTFAEAGESYHNYGLAFDVVEIKNGKAIWENPNWDNIGTFGKQLGFEWGGDWKGRKRDRPHFQMRFGKHHSELAALYRNNQKDGHYIKLV